MPTKSSADAVRLRENQRRSRERRKEYVADLESRWQQCQRTGIEASVELQKVARRVVDMNNRLRDLLREKGVGDDEIDAWLRDVGEGDGVDATVQGAVKLLGSQPCGGPSGCAGEARNSNRSKAPSGTQAGCKKAITNLEVPISPPSSSGACSDNTPPPQQPLSSAPTQSPLPAVHEQISPAHDSSLIPPQNIPSVRHSTAIQLQSPQAQRIPMGPLTIDPYNYPISTTPSTTSFCVPSNNTPFPAYPYHDFPPHFEVQVTAQHVPGFAEREQLPQREEMQCDSTPCDVARELIHGFQSIPQPGENFEQQLCPQGASNGCVVDNRLLFGLLDGV